MRVLLGAVLVLLGAAACDAFCPGPMDCLSNGAVVVRVIDADTQAPVTDATVSDSAGNIVGNCPFDFEAAGADAGPSNCRAIAAPGSYHLTLRAPGYVDATLDVDSPRDQCGDFKSQVRTVGLRKTGTSLQPSVKESWLCGG